MKFREYFLYAKKKIITIYSAILLPKLPSSAILESIPERNQRNERCVSSESACCLLNENNADYVQRKHAHASIVFWVLSKIVEDSNSGRRIAE